MSLNETFTSFLLQAEDAITSEIQSLKILNEKLNNIFTKQPPETLVLRIHPSGHHFALSYCWYYCNLLDRLHCKKNWFTSHFNPARCYLMLPITKGNEMFYLMTHSTYFIYRYMTSDMVKNHLYSEKGNPLLPLHGLLFSISSKGLLYAPFHRQDNTYHSLCYTSRGALAGTRNSSVDLPWGIDPRTYCTMLTIELFGIYNHENNPGADITFINNVLH